MDATNRVVAGWILEERLGSGGFGEVWKARRRHLDLFRALKLMRVASEAAFASWRHEISRLEELSHPNIVRFYDADIVSDDGPYDDFAWIATELCQHSLADELRYRPDHVLGPAECERMVEAMLGALAAAHANGGVHRDVKPANILRHPAVGWKLCDFGTARLIPAGESHAHTAVIGTFPYMSPAAHRGRQDQAADLYALGVTVHEARCGLRLHPRDPEMTDSEYVKFILDEPPRISPRLDVRANAVVAALIGDHGPLDAVQLLDWLHGSGGLTGTAADPATLAPPPPAPVPAPAPQQPALPPPPAATDTTTVTAREARSDTRRYPTGARPPSTGRPPTRSPTHPTSGSSGRAAPQPRREREHLGGVLLLILGSVTIAGVLLYQLVPSPLAIIAFSAAIVLILALLIALS